MKKILYISITLLTLIGGIFVVFHKAEAAYDGGGPAAFVDITSPHDSLVRRFVFYPGTPHCPDYQIEPDGINPNIPPQNVGLGDTLNSIIIRDVTTGATLINGTHYSWQNIGSGFDGEITIQVNFQNSVSKTDTYNIRSSQAVSFGCAYDSYSGAFIASTDFDFKLAISPQASIISFTASPNPLLRSNSTTLTWRTSNATWCSILPGLQGNPSIGINDSIGVVVRDPVTFTLTCGNGTSVASRDVPVTTFYDTLLFNGYTLNKCTDNPSTAVKWGSNVTNPPTQFGVHMTFPGGSKDYIPPSYAFLSGTPQKPSDNVWSLVPRTYSVIDPGTVPITSPTGMTYCSNSGAQTFDSIINQVTKEIKLYFAPVGGPSSPTNFGIIGECHQNDSTVSPQTKVQEFLGWSPVAGAAKYRIYNASNNQLIAETQNTWYVDLNVTFDTTYSYYITAVDASGKESAHSNTLSAKTPTAAFCSTPPSPPPGASKTYVIVPPSKTIQVNSNFQFNGLFDPDGTDVRYGNFVVNSLASWGITTPLIASSLGSGLYKGLSSGGQFRNVNSTYSGIIADATLNVTDPVDFDISITPGLRTVQRPGSASYTVTITPLNGFNGLVALTVLNLHNGTTGNLVPASISGGGNSTLTLTVAGTATVEQYTFTVRGISGGLDHTAAADINVSAPPGVMSCSISANPNPVDAGTPVGLSATVNGGSGNYRYRFFYEPGSIDIDYLAGSSRSYTYLSAGVKNPSVDVFDVITSNTTNCSTNVTVNESGPPVEPPVGSLSCTLDAAPKFGPAPLGVLFQISNVLGGSGNYQYSFSYGDGQSAPYPASNPSSHTYNNQGSYTATGSVKDDAGKSGSCSKDVTGNDITIVVNPPTPSGCSFTASPSAVLYGQSSTLTWSCNPTETPRDCTVTRVSDGSEVATGSQSGSTKVKPTLTTDYKLSCSGDPAVEDSTTRVSVGFIPVIREIIPR